MHIVIRSSSFFLSLFSIFHFGEFELHGCKINLSCTNELSNIDFKHVDSYREFEKFNFDEIVMMLYLLYNLFYIFQSTSFLF